MTQLTRPQKIEALAALIGANDPSLTPRQCRRATDLIDQMTDIRNQIDDLQDRLGR
ncbi:MAG TPA: hypothetical protein V6D29_24645 [Leptolyngbyaceae cyanobacterium]